MSEQRQRGQARISLDRPIIQDIGLALGAVGLVAILGGGGLYFAVAELQVWALRLLGVGVVLTILSIALAWRPLFLLLRARQGRYGLNTAVMVLALLGILAVGNVVAAATPIRIDLTATQEFTLAEQTKQVLKRIDQPVKAEGFFTPLEAASQAAAENLLREFSVQNRNLSYQILDPDVNLSAAIRRGARAGEVVFLVEDRVEKTAEISERAFVTALLQVTGAELKTVCFLEGHGEPSPRDSSNAGMSEALAGLERDNFLVQGFNSATREDLSTIVECSVLVVAGPTQDLTPPEQEMLAGFLRSYGKAVFLLDPSAPETFREVLRPWSVLVGTQPIIDPSNRSDPGAPIVPAEGFNLTPITELLDVAVFPEVTQVMLIGDPNQGPNRDYLAVTQPGSWLEAGDVDNPTFDETEDIRGPIPIGALLQSRPTAQETEVARVVVFGDSDFAKNGFFYTRSNADLFLNSVNWVAEQNYLISVRPKPPAFRVLLLTDLQWRFILVSSVALLPLLVGIVGSVAWWLRR